MAVTATLPRRSVNAIGPPVTPSTTKVIRASGPVVPNGTSAELDAATAGLPELIFGAGARKTCGWLSRHARRASGQTASRAARERDAIMMAGEELQLSLRVSYV
jgi:hypothetical protein